MELMGVLMKRLKAPLSAWHKHTRSGLWTMSRNGRQQSAGGAPARPLRKGTHDKSWESVPMQSAGNVCVGCGGGGGEGDGLGGGAPVAAVARMKTRTKAMISISNFAILMEMDLLRVTHSRPSLIYSKGCLCWAFTLLAPCRPDFSAVTHVLDVVT